MNDRSFYKNVTLLITHYNRVASLERLLQQITKLSLAFEEIIVADDGSEPDKVKALEELSHQYHFRLVTSPVNRGLGHNMNKGQNAVKTPYTLYVQEDFLPVPEFVRVLSESLAFLQSDPKLDMVRFFANFKFPYVKPFNAEFDELQVPVFGKDYHKIYAYSDNPHLRRSNFLEKFGAYKENIPGDRTEYYMCISFAKKRGRVLLHKKIKGLFGHDNLGGEPTTMTRGSWTQNENKALAILRNVYRQVRYNFDLLKPWGN